jgi:hypothetical protein
MDLKARDMYRCPEDHVGKIMWISEDRRIIAVRHPQRHFSKMMKVADHNKSMISRHFHTKEKKVFVKNMVFLIRI